MNWILIAFIFAFLAGCGKDKAPLESGAGGDSFRGAAKVDPHKNAGDKHDGAETLSTEILCLTGADSLITIGQKSVSYALPDCNAVKYSYIDDGSKTPARFVSSIRVSDVTITSSINAIPHVDVRSPLWDHLAGAPKYRDGMNWKKISDFYVNVASSLDNIIAYLKDIDKPAHLTLMHGRKMIVRAHLDGEAASGATIAGRRVYFGLTCSQAADLWNTLAPPKSGHHGAAPLDPHRNFSALGRIQLPHSGGIMASDTAVPLMCGPDWTESPIK